MYDCITSSLLFPFFLSVLLFSHCFIKHHPVFTSADLWSNLALMIHGGGHMTLSRKAIRPLQTEHLLGHDVLPVSIDYRLCPEINLIDGPITDVHDALAWVQNEEGLQAAIKDEGIVIDENRVVMIGWSTGGHLAMTTAWTSQEAGLKPPKAILSLYGPTDFVSGGELSFYHGYIPYICHCLSVKKKKMREYEANPKAELDQRRAEMYPDREMAMDKIISSLPTQPVRFPLNCPPFSFFLSPFSLLPDLQLHHLNLPHH